MKPNSGKMPRHSKPIFVRWAWNGAVEGPFVPAQWRTMNWNRGGVNDIEAWDWAEAKTHDGRQSNGSYE